MSPLNLGNPPALIEAGEAVNPNPFGIRTASLLPRLNGWLTRVVVATLRAAGARFLVWQPALPLYLALGAGVVALCRPGGGTVLLVLAPALLNTAEWLLLSIGPYVRYQWPLFLVTPLALCLAAGRTLPSPAFVAGGTRGRRGGSSPPDGIRVARARTWSTRSSRSRPSATRSSSWCARAAGSGS